MKKVIIVLIVLLLFVVIVLNASKNTSSTELLLNESKARNNIEDIITAIDVVGEAAFKGVEIETKGFKGEVKQPPSSATNYLTTYNIKGDGNDGTDANNLKITYGDNKIAVEGKGDAFTEPKYAHLGLPANTRKSLLSKKAEAIPMDTLYDNVKSGLQPIIKDTNSADWLDDFIFGDTGMGLDKLIAADGDFSEFKEKINNNNKDNRIKFMEFVFGNPQPDELKWNEFNSDRVISMVQVDTKALTGLDNNESIQKLINPNLNTLYRVEHVNTNLLNSLEKDTTAMDTFGLDAVKLSKLANHLNQTMGGKLVLIPNQTASTLVIDGIPTFVLN